jgi:hypothetical protein
LLAQRQLKAKLATVALLILLLWLAQPFFSDLSVICLLHALGASRLDIGKPPLFFWHNSRYLILLSIIPYLLIRSSLRGFEISNFSLLDLIVTAQDVAVITYVFSSKLIKDTPSEFPEFVPSDKPI